MSQFGDLLRHYRVEAGLTQEDLADHSGVSVRTISDLERGLKQTPRQVTISLLAQALGLSDDENGVLRTAAENKRDVDPGQPLASTVPAPLTPFVGRVREIQEVREMLLGVEVRLVTLTGPGGTGKTRLALQVANTVPASFPDGLYFVDLAAIREPDLVAARIAQTIGVPATAQWSVTADLEAYLRDRQALLILDNFEQVVLAGPLVARLLAGCSRLKVLVTSRVVVRVSGEHIYSVPPLQVPDLQTLPPPEQLAEYEAVRLFVMRATAASPSFALTADNVSAVATICRRLEGLPLAIELAAARLRVLSPQALATRLSDRLGLLTGGAQDVPSRQQTLRATLDWSYQLLQPDEQQLLAQLAVFAGGCTVEEAQAIVDRNAHIDVLGGVSSLVDHSLLLRRDGRDGEMRFHMLETIREYALARLAEGGDSDATQLRHAQYYLQLAEAAERELKGSGQARALTQLEAEHDNLRSALLWAHQSGRADLGLRLAGALGWFWLMRGYFTEGRMLLNRALALPNGSPEARAKVLAAKGMLVWRQGDFPRAMVLLTESLALYRELGDETGAAYARHHLAHVHEAQGDLDAAVKMLENSLAVFRHHDETWGLVLSLNCLGAAWARQGEHDRARGLVEEALQRAVDVGDRHGQADSLRLLGVDRLRRREITKAIGLLEESLAVCGVLEDKQGSALSLRALAHAAMQAGESERAQELSAYSLQLAEDLGDRSGVAEDLVTLAVVVCRDGDYERAARLLGPAGLVQSWTHVELSPSAQASCDQATAFARAHLGDEHFSTWYNEGRSLTVREAVAHFTSMGE